MNTLKVSMLCLALSVSATTVAQTCDDAHGKPGVTIQTIKLLPPPKGASFYYRTDDFVVLALPDAVMDVIQAGKPQPDAEKLATLIHSDMPLAANQDFFRYNFADWTYWSLIQSVVMVLLERGDASFINLGGIPFDHVTVVHDRRVKGSTTEIFAGRRGENRIFRHFDCIVD